MNEHRCGEFLADGQISDPIRVDPTSAWKYEFEYDGECQFALLEFPDETETTRSAYLFIGYCRADHVLRKFRLTVEEAGQVFLTASPHPWQLVGVLGSLERPVALIAQQL